MKTICRIVVKSFYRVALLAGLLSTGRLEAEEAAGSAGRKARAGAAVELTDEAMRMHREALVFDGHNDLTMHVRSTPTLTWSSLDLSKRQPALHTDIPRLRQGGVGAQFWSVYVSVESAKKGTGVREALEQIEQIHQLAERYPDTFAMATRADDVVRLHKEGKIASLIGIEGGHAIDNSLAVLRTFHQAGVRYMTFTNSESHDWADSAVDQAKHRGLTEFGEQVVREMNRLGMLIDLSHASMETARHAMLLSESPVLFSHSAAHALAPHPRNLPDDILRLLAKNGGVVLVNFYPGFLTAEAVQAYDARTKEAAKLRKQFPKDEQFKPALAKWLQSHPLPAVGARDLVDHIDHIVRVAGIDHVGLGSNFDGVVSVCKQLEDVSTFPIITQEMLNRGYTREQVHKILGGNLLRVLREAEAASQVKQARTK